MSTALVPAPAPPPERTLDELAEIANREHVAVAAALSASLIHALRCGEAVLAAREQIGTVAWSSWCARKLTFSPQAAGRYMRLAAYKDQLPQEVWEPWRDASGYVRDATFSRAMVYVRGLPALYPNVAHRAIAADTQTELRRLRAAGATYAEISETLGISLATVWRYLSPGAKKRHQQKQREHRHRVRRAFEAARAQDERRARDLAARKAGGALADAYSFIRRAAQKLDVAHSEATDPEARSALADALTRLLSAEDSVAVSLRVPPHPRVNPPSRSRVRRKTLVQSNAPTAHQARSAAGASTERTLHDERDPDD